MEVGTVNINNTAMRRAGIALGGAALIGSTLFIGGSAQAAPRDQYPMIARAMSECGLIDVGVRGTCVYTVQQTLNESQHEQLAIDSTYGPATKAAVRRFQLANGLEPDGVVGERTKQALRDVMQQAADKLDKGEAKSGVDSWVTDALCGMTGPFVLGCLTLTH
jgi:peptidoglycan hydrolase-like protein with peptidoglycan-binding domain